MFLITNRLHSLILPSILSLTTTILLVRIASPLTWGGGQTFPQFLQKAFVYVEEKMLEKLGRIAIMIKLIIIAIIILISSLLQSQDGELKIIFDNFGKSSWQENWVGPSL